MIGAKEYLLGLERLDARINVLQAEKDELKDKLQHITPTLSPDKGSGGSGTQDKAAAIIAKMIDLESKINGEINRLIDTKREALALLDRVDNPTYMTVLHRRYFLRASLPAIAADMGYTVRGMQKLHGRALQAYDKLLAEKKAAHTVEK